MKLHLAFAKMRWRCLKMGGCAALPLLTKNFPNKQSNHKKIEKLVFHSEKSVEKSDGKFGISELSPYSQVVSHKKHCRF